MSFLKYLRWRPRVESGRWVFRERRFFNVCDYNDLWSREFSETDFYDCTFDNCGLALKPRSPKRRSIVRDVRLFNCQIVNSSCGPAIFDNVLFDGLRTTSRKGHRLDAWGPAFRHVVLRGRVGRARISTAYVMVRGNPEREAAFELANEEFYKQVDWALDISEVESEYLEIEGVPARLIRRDPRSQAVVTRSTVSRYLEEYGSEDLEGNHFRYHLTALKNYGAEDRVLIADKLAPHYRRQLESIQILRNMGIAEPN